MGLLLAAPLASSAHAATVGLGTADGFAVLAGSTVTNTGPSVINGNVGLHPGSAVVGFPPGTVTGGTIHAADGVALQAKTDLTTAYNDAAGRPSSATISADLAGRTLTRGVYTSASSMGLSGDLTLDAQGDADAVFIFQAGSTLTTASGSRVLLTGGAQACNVFWQVGSSATVGTGSAFVGSILALTSISMTTGATLNGRALARNGAVTLDTNTITRSACAAGTAGANGTPVSTGTGSGSGSGGPGTSIRLTGPPTSGPNGPSVCVSKSFRARVTGRSIAQVTFYVDSKKRGSVLAKPGRTVFSLLIRPASRSIPVHRLRATVRFTAASGARARSLNLVYRDCGSVAGALQFTG